MIRVIEARNYRCLLYMKRHMDDFQILVGPNASGKTTFLDVVAFLGDLLSKGLDEAVTLRTSNFEDLLFKRRGERFELAVEMEIPEEKARALSDPPTYRFIRYEISIGLDRESGEIRIRDEQVILLKNHSCDSSKRQSTLFPDPLMPPDTIMHPRQVGKAKKRIIRKVEGGNDNFYSEIGKTKGIRGWGDRIRLGPQRSALAYMPEDERTFPASIWLRDILINRVQNISLNSRVLRSYSRPGQGRLLKPDGENLPWVIHALREANPQQHADWVRHVATALPDLRDITTVERLDIRHRFLQLVYSDDFRVPSWIASDGTLRLLALTLLAYIENFRGIYMIEEPENGIHPMAMETVYQALRSVYGGQVLLATHSPVLLGCANLKEILCFKKDADGATDIVSGLEHPKLQAWKGSLSLGDLYASGVLG